MNLLISQTDILMMGFLLPPESVGIYRVALTLSALSLFFVTPLSVILAPQLVREWSSGNKAALQTLSTEIARLSFLLSLPIFISIFLFSSQIIDILYGNAFAGSNVPLIILCIGQFVNVATGFVHVVLNMTKHHDITLWGVGFAVSANVILNALLIPQFGITGGAIATATAVTLANVYLLIRLRSATGIDSSVLGMGKPQA
jgi:O-antigen/teichoic acid export membrane protein